MASAERESKRGSGSGVQGHSPLWGSGGPKAETFLSMFIQKVVKS